MNAGEAAGATSYEEGGSGWRKGLGDGVKVKVTQAVYPLHNGRS